MWAYCWSSFIVSGIAVVLYIDAWWLMVGGGLVFWICSGGGWVDLDCWLDGGLVVIVAVVCGCVVYG